MDDMSDKNGDGVLNFDQPTRVQQRLQELAGKNAGDLTGEEVVKLILGDQPLAEIFNEAKQPEEVDGVREILNAANLHAPTLTSDQLRQLRPTDHLLRYFVWEHLPEPLALIVRMYRDLALGMLAETETGPEQTFALRQLLLSKDAAVRAAL